MDLRDRIIEIFDRYMEGNLPSDQFADEILALFEGWKSPEEVAYSVIKCPDCGATFIGDDVYGKEGLRKK